MRISSRVQKALKSPGYLGAKPEIDIRGPDQGRQGGYRRKEPVCLGLL